MQAALTCSISGCFPPTRVSEDESLGVYREDREHPAAKLSFSCDLQRPFDGASSGLHPVREGTFANLDCPVYHLLLYSLVPHLLLRSPGRDRTLQRRSFCKKRTERPGGAASAEGWIRGVEMFPLRAVTAPFLKSGTQKIVDGDAVGVVGGPTPTVWRGN